ncbi:hypothetical protein GOODEAATRI_011152 [Goodea atripinnis]|uniref:Ribose-phosphate pyrophosphokinase N-terminal domain-containing protein n=1 Tax=Goodea atripinnis TaxID=208336 RepID=A0ABV0N0F4_9TELE
MRTPCTIMELLIMAYALKTSCAKNIIGVIPYFPYSKQCKMRKRGSIVCKLLASMAQSYAERLRLGLAVIHGEAQCAESDMADGRHSPPCDDIIDDVGDFVAAAEILKERGAYKIYIMATHGLLSADAPRLIEESAIDVVRIKNFMIFSHGHLHLPILFLITYSVVVTNTVPHEVQKLQCPKIKTVDVSMILAEAIRRIHNGESMAYLFRNITVDD